MLTDRQLERYSRQILLPEVGGRGQEGLLAATVVVAGCGEAAAIATALLGRAGVGTLALAGADAPPGAPSPDCRMTRYDATTDVPPGDVVVELSAGAHAGALLRRHATAGRPGIIAAYAATSAILATLVGRPCIVCLPADALEPPRGPGGRGLAGPLAVLVGALAAAEALRVLLCPPAHGRIHRLALEEGTFAAGEPVSSGGCAVCGGTA